MFGGSTCLSCFDIWSSGVKGNQLTQLQRCNDLCNDLFPAHNGPSCWELSQHTPLAAWENPPQVVAAQWMPWRCIIIYCPLYDRIITCIYSVWTGSGKWYFDVVCFVEAHCVSSPLDFCWTAWDWRSHGGNQKSDVENELSDNSQHVFRTVDQILAYSPPGVLGFMIS